MFRVPSHEPHGPDERSAGHLPHAIYADWAEFTGSSSAAEISSSCGLQSNINLPPCTQRGSSKLDPSLMLSNVVLPEEPSLGLPAYIEPLRGVPGYDEVTYLQTMGALTIPPIPLRDQLLKQFAELVHPFMPVLNIHDLVGTIDRNDGTKTVSLLLFQAIMFAGVATVDMWYLTAAGYKTRREARRDFFHRTRLIFQSSYEDDSISRIQSLLLMTLWYEKPDDQQDSCYWMGIAVTLSQSIGLHECDREHSYLDPSTRCLWRRISWSAYIRDRMIALGMRHPTSIKTIEFKVPMLTLEDFEIGCIPDGPSCIPSNCTILREPGKQRDMALLCIEQAKLCTCIDFVLSAPYALIHSNSSITKNTPGAMAAAASVTSIADEVQKRDRILREWEASIAEEAMYSDPMWAELDTGSEEIVLHRTLLRLTYYATISALHRPQVLSQNKALPKWSKAAKQLEFSMKAVNQAANEITRLANNLYKQDLVRYLPTTATTVLLPAIIAHVLNVKTADRAMRKASVLGFNQCMQVVAKLQDMYAIAEQLVAFFEAEICKADATLLEATEEVRELRTIITALVCEMGASREMPLQQHSTPLAASSSAEAQFEHDQGEHIDDNVLSPNGDCYNWATTIDPFTGETTNSELVFNSEQDALQEPWFLAMNAEL